MIHYYQVLSSSQLQELFLNFTIKIFLFFISHRLDFSHEIFTFNGDISSSDHIALDEGEGMRKEAIMT